MTPPRELRATFLASVMTIITACAASDGRTTVADPTKRSGPDAAPPGIEAGTGGAPGRPTPDAAPADRPTTTPTDGGVAPTGTDPLAALPRGAAQRNLLCGRGNGDTVALKLCAGATPPPITSLSELQKLLGIDPVDYTHTSVALNSHSSSLVMRFTSPINPRAIIFTRPSDDATMPNPTYVAMGFVRGEQFVELLSKDTKANGVLRFYLFKFEQACNAMPGGCRPGDLLTPEIERGYTGYTLYEDKDLANTIFDCMQCHQPNGPGTQKIPRMQELIFPWTHWIFDEPPANQLMCDDFIAAHKNETYAGIPPDELYGPSPYQPAPDTCLRTPNGVLNGPPALLAFLQNNNFGNCRDCEPGGGPCQPAARPGCTDQPNEFLTQKIRDEVEASSPNQPAVNVPPGQSATWNMLYDNYLAGKAIPPSYHDFRITDAAKLKAMTNAYRAVMAGTTPRDQLPDIRDVFLDAALPDMTIRPRPGQSGRATLVQMCQQCHNSHLDQTISRARFNVEKLDQMGRAERDVAIERINLPRTEARHMPPNRFRDLSAQDIAAVTQELMK